MYLFNLWSTVMLKDFLFSFALTAVLSKLLVALSQIGNVAMALLIRV